ncbi:CASP-like protein 4A3 [Hibiscus syriacus]|uniref:CASP-like protein n=1 Tax=Hibiscus syriacus TaxID=106335 RepID=A0A6A2ZJA2_HIBSY|nr:CASP-like protein 4A3 [Hibiscus syriacus]
MNIIKNNLKYIKSSRRKKNKRKIDKNNTSMEKKLRKTSKNPPRFHSFLLPKKTTQSLPSDPSPVDSPLSSDNSSLSHGFSPPQPTLSPQPSEPNSKPPPAAAVSRAELTSRDQPTVTTVELEEQIQKLSSAADKSQGWALYSFYRYKEFRFCMAVNVIGFLYSGIQAYDLAYQLTSGKRKPRSHLQCYIDFALDQILAYLLISASSSAAVRVDDWQSNWGKDKFPEMARASMALSLVAYVALALSSLVSGYHLCTFKSM